MMKKILHTDLIGEVKPRKGFSGINTGRYGYTAPWSRLEKVGHETISNEERPFTGNKKLLIRQGGIEDEKISRYYKTIFREDVFPAIVNFDSDCRKMFWLIMHFKKDLLMLAEVEYIDKQESLPKDGH